MEPTPRWRAIAAIAGVIVVVVGGIVFAANRSRKVTSPKKVTEVELQRGDMSIKLTREGALTVRTPEGLFEQQWDEERVRAFFAKFESENFSKFEQFRESTTGYILRIVSEDGTQRTIYLPFLDIPLPESVGELVTVLEQVTSGGGPSLPTPFPTSIIFPTRPPTPTPLPTKTAPSPTPTPSGSRKGGYGKGNPPQQPFTCEFTDPNIDPDILSETVCTPE